MSSAQGRPAHRCRDGARKFQALAGELGKGRSAEQIAEGFLTVAVENMANAIKEISIERGHDVTQYALCCFGGAGGQHACRVADALGMTTVFLHPLAGVLSAYGMGLADVRVLRELAVEATLAAELLPELQAGLDRLAGEAERELEAQGVPDGDRAAHKRLHTRYAGNDTALVVPMGSIGELQAFEATASPALRLRRAGQGADRRSALGRAGGQNREAGGDPSGAAALGQTGAQGRGGLLHRRRVAEDPALSARGDGGGGAHRGSRDHRRAHGHHRAGAGLGSGEMAEAGLSRAAIGRSAQAAVGTAVDPVMLEVFNNLFMSIAKQMG
jgi:5-oxoprolinase (ATP-hydrolysing)